MFVTFSWPIVPRALDKSAKAIVQAIKDSGRLEDLLEPVESVHGFHPKLLMCEVIQMEIRGLSSNLYLMPVWGVYNIPIWQKIEDVADLLQEFIGVEPRILINGNQSVLSYAAQEEYRARKFRAALDEAREALKETRRWLKDPRVADIRQRIDRRLEDSEKGAAFVGVQRVLVYEEKTK